jgi:hypothetical protein
MLNNRNQPRGDQEVLCHVTLPLGLIPPNQVIKGPDKTAVNLNLRTLPQDSLFPTPPIYMCKPQVKTTLCSRSFG